MIDKVVKNYLSDQYNSKESTQIKLPYVGFFSRNAHNKIKEIIKKLCKDEVSVNLVFVPYKIGSMFSTNDRVPSFLKSMVVYKLVYTNCGACYLGEMRTVSVAVPIIALLFWIMHQVSTS